MDALNPVVDDKEETKTVDIPRGTRRCSTEASLKHECRFNLWVAIIFLGVVTLFEECMCGWHLCERANWHLIFHVLRMCRNYPGI